MYTLALILLFVIIYAFLFSVEPFDNNYSNNIYAIRPPYKMAKKYNPDNLNPYKILKDNFLPYPMEGYQDTVNYLSKKEKNIDTKSLNMIDKQFNNMKDVGYSIMTDNEKYIRKMVNNLEQKDIPLVDMRI